MRLVLAAATLIALSTPAGAAGGHFDVDDATMLDPGQCQIEAWVVRAPVASATLAHAGPGCRVGPVEAGLNIDRVTTDGSGRTLLGPQLKWVADPLLGRVSVGVVWSAAYDLTNRGRPAQLLYLPLTWRVAETFWVHANIGQDRDLTGERWRRQGGSGEWAASDRLTFIAERVKITGDWSSRVGGRLHLGEKLSLDLSVARAGPRAERVYALGLNQEFAR